MQILEYAFILRRRWSYLAIGVALGAVAGFFTAPGVSAEGASYQATHTLLVDTSSSSAQGLNLDQTALVVSRGAVPQRVAQGLAAAGQPRASKLSATADPELRSLKIIATSSTPQGAAIAADLAAQELNAELSGVQVAVIEEERLAAETRVTEAEDQITELDAQLFPLAPEDPNRSALEAERRSLVQTLDQVEEELQILDSTAVPRPPLRTLESGRGRPAVTEGWRIPEARPVRAGMLGGFGLLLGVAGALAADRLDTRVRNREDAERAFDLPVIAEVPPIPSGTKGRELLVATRPAAPFVEAYRSLRTVVLFAASQGEGTPPSSNGSNGHGPAAPEPEPPSQVILVTSPSAGEGKTTSAAHLAAVLAEVGKRVLVVSGDFRRPRIHELFGVAREPGLADVLASGTGSVRLSDLQMQTKFAGVHLLPSGRPVDNPAQLLTETALLIGAARDLFDYIVLDTPPLLVANDATELAAVADMVILFAKADRTSRDASRRSTEILRRVDAPILGVVVVAAHDSPTAYGYYRYRYYADTDQGAGGKRRLRSKKNPKVEALPVGSSPSPPGL